MPFILSIMLWASLQSQNDLVRQPNVQIKNAFTLQCEFKSLPDQSKVYLISEDGDTLCRATSMHENFSFVGPKDAGERIAYIAFEPHITPFPTETFFLTLDTLYIEGTIGNYTNNKLDIYVKGSQETDEIRRFTRFANFHYSPILPILTKLEVVKNKIVNTAAIYDRENGLSNIETSLRSELDSALQLYRHQLTNYISKQNNSLATPYILLNLIKDLDLKYIQDQYKNLPEKEKNSRYGKKLYQEMYFAQKYKNIQGGSLIPNAVITDTTSRNFNLHEVIRGHKLILIDFWASWCTPCRKEVPKLKSAFDQLKGGKFMIIGLSLDEDKEKWINAIEADKSTWLHFKAIDVENLRKSFGINGIPAYMLLDENGKILAYDCALCEVESFGESLRDSDLTSKLKHLLSKQ